MPLVDLGRGTSGSCLDEINEERIVIQRSVLRWKWFHKMLNGRGEKSNRPTRLLKVETCCDRRSGQINGDTSICVLVLYRTVHVSTYVRPR